MNGGLQNGFVPWEYCNISTTGRDKLNAFHAASECRLQATKLTKFVKNVEIVKVHDHIWNHNEKCIQLSTNMPSIGLVISEIISEMLEF